MLEEGLDLDLRTERGADAGHEPGGEQRVAAEGEEVVVGARGVQTEHVGEEPAQDLLADGAGGSPAGRRGVAGCGQGTPVHLAVDGQRQCVQEDERGGHHVGGQGPPDGPGELARFGACPVRGHHVRDEPPVARGVLPYDGEGVGHALAAGQHALDLAEFDAVAAQFHLPVGTADVGDLSVIGPPDEVAGAVHASARRVERVGHEACGGQTGEPRVPACHAASREVQLAHDARRDLTEGPVEDVQAHAVQGAADGRRPGGEVRRHVVAGGEGGGLGGPVHMEDPYAGRGAGDPLHRVRRGQFPAGADEPEAGEGARIGLGDHVEQRGRQEDRGHPVLPDGVAECPCLQDPVRRDDDPPAVQERSPYLEGGGVEDVRRVHQYGVAGAALPGGVGGERGHVGVRDADTLGQTGGAGREHDVGERSGTRDRGGPGRPAGPAPQDPAEPVDDHDRCPAGRVGHPGGGGGVLVDDEDPHVRHPGGLVEPFLRPAGVQRDVGAGRPDRPQGHRHHGR